jgi:membrane associated rhomboid family serine protease
MNITLIIVVITAIISISAFSNQRIIDELIFTPPAVSKRNQWYRFLTCALIHADFMHLGFNMYSFYMFGGLVEDNFRILFESYGPILYLALYVISQFLCLLPTYLKNKENYYYRSLGASGAVSAVIFAGIFLFPMQKLGIILIPIGIPGFIFGFIYLAISVYLDRKGTSNINHSAHFYGAIAGIMLLIVFGYAFSQYDLLQNFVMQMKQF